MRAGDIQSRFNDEVRAGVNPVDAFDMHALFYAAVGDMSPAGRTPIDVAVLREIAAGSLPDRDWSVVQAFFNARGGDPVAAARWALGL